jgi:hypothetical protein
MSEIQERGGLAGTSFRRSPFWHIRYRIGLSAGRPLPPESDRIADIAACLKTGCNGPVMRAQGIETLEYRCRLTDASLGNKTAFSARSKEMAIMPAALS